MKFEEFILSRYLIGSNKEKPEIRFISGGTLGNDLLIVRDDQPKMIYKINIVLRNPELRIVYTGASAIFGICVYKKGTATCLATVEAGNDAYIIHLLDQKPGGTYGAGTFKDIKEFRINVNNEIAKFKLFKRINEGAFLIYMKGKKEILELEINPQDSMEYKVSVRYPIKGMGLGNHEFEIEYVYSQDFGGASQTSTVEKLYAITNKSSSVWIFNLISKKEQVFDLGIGKLIYLKFLERKRDLFFLSSDQSRSIISTINVNTLDLKKEPPSRLIKCKKNWIINNLFIINSEEVGLFNLTDYNIKRIIYK